MVPLPLRGSKNLNSLLWGPGLVVELGLVMGLGLVMELEKVTGFEDFRKTSGKSSIFNLQTRQALKRFKA